MVIWDNVPHKVLLGLATHYLGESASISIALADLMVSGDAGYFTLRHVSGPLVASCELFVRTKFRRAGWSDKFEACKREMALAAGATVMVATVNSENEAELAAIAKHGWTRICKVPPVEVWMTRLVAGPPEDDVYTML